MRSGRFDFKKKLLAGNENLIFQVFVKNMVG